MTSIFHNETVSEPNVTPQAAGFWAASIGACLAFVVSLIEISNSRSSTAAIGYIFLPFIAAVAAIPCFVAGWCLGYALIWWRSSVQWRKRSAFVAALVPVIVGLWILRTLSVGVDMTQDVHKIEHMDGGQLERVLDDPKLAHNKFILGAIAQNPKAESRTLHRIATTKLPALHERIGSPFDVMGKNTRGLAVMRLVATHPNTAAEDLEKLAQSKNEFVLGDVASNPKLSTGTLRKLADHGGQLIEWGLARNPAAPVDLLFKLALSADEYTRAAVASNAHTAADVLRGLSVDPAWNVRGHVALNPATPTEVRETLLKDSDERVQRYARRP